MPVLSADQVPKVDLVVSPLPCKDWVWVQNIAKGRYLVELMSMDGRTLTQWEASLPGQVSFSSLKNGCYMLRLSNAGKQSVHKLIINR
jgi:hypothetical protein